LVCEPDSALVAFHLRKEWLEKHADRVRGILREHSVDPEASNYLNMLVYERINQAEEDFLYIARSTTLGLTTGQTYQAYKQKKDALRYAGKKENVYDYVRLMAHIMEHTREEDVDLLIRRLKEEAQKLIG